MNINSTNRRFVPAIVPAGGTFDVVFVGTGRQAWEHRIPALRSIPGTRIVGFVDTTLPLAQKRAAMYNDPKVIADWRDVGYPIADEGAAAPQVFADLAPALAQLRPHGVEIVTPPFAHAEPAIQALRAGVHAKGDKPMADNLDSARAMGQVAAETGRLLQVGYQNAHAAPWAAGQIRAGAIGEVRGGMVRWTRLTGVPDAEHFWTTGVDYDLAGHLVAPLQVLLGNGVQIDRVTAEGRNEVGRRLYGDDNFPAFDTVEAKLYLSNGGMVELLVSWALGEGPDDAASLALTGTEGELHVDLVPQKGIGYKPNLDEFDQWVRPTGGVKAFGPKPLAYTDLVLADARNFVNAAKGLEDLVLSTEAAVATEVVVDAIHRAAVTRKPVTLAS